MFSMFLCGSFIPSTNFNAGISKENFIFSELKIIYEKDTNAMHDPPVFFLQPG